MQTSHIASPVLNAHTDAKTAAAAKIQTFYRTYRAYHAISDFLEFKIEEASKKNFASIRKCLRKGADRFEKNIADNHTKRLLTKQEAFLFAFILENLTLKHSTGSLPAIQEKGDNALLSIRERVRRDKSTYNSHTGTKHNRDDFIYFTLGIGDHQSIYGENTPEITVHPLEVMSKDKLALAGMWVSAHDRDFSVSSISRPILFGETKFFYSHDRKTREKTYTFEKNGQITKKTVHYEEEIFSGGHVLPGIAYYFLYLLRLIGGSYRENLLAKATDPSTPLEVKQNMLTAAMDYILPAWQFPEAKVPVRFSLNNPGVEICDLKDVQKKRKYLDFRDNELYTAIQEHDLDKLKQLADKGQDFSVKFLYFGHIWTPLELAIRDPDCPNKSLNRTTGKILQIVEFLISKGAVAHEPGSSALLMAITDVRCALVEYFLNLSARDSRDPSITLLSNPNETLHEMSHPLYLLLTSRYGTAAQIKEIMQLLIAHGSDPKLVGNLLLQLAAASKFYRGSGLDVSSLQLLVDAGLDPSKNPQIGASPLMTLAGSPDQLAEMRFFIEHGADVNARLESQVPMEEEGYTALHFAAKSNIEAAGLLLEAGADPQIEGTNGKKPLDVAVGDKKTDLATLIQFYEKKFTLINEALTEDMPSIYSWFVIVDRIKNLVSAIFSYWPFSAASAERSGQVDPIAAASTEKSKVFIPVHVHSAVALIVGNDAQGNKMVVLGTKRTVDGKNPRQIFPGGYKSIRDASFVDAAIREVEEETNMELGKWIKEDGIQPAQLHRFESVNLAKDKKFIIEFYLFDVGDRLKDIKLIAKDDLVTLSKYQLDDTVNRSICHSNDILLHLIRSGTEVQDWQKKLDTALEIETDAVAKLNKALQENDESMLKAICSNPALLDARDRIEIDKLLRIAAEKGSETNIDSLLGYAKLLNAKKQWKQILALGAELGNMKIIETTITNCNKVFNYYRDASAEAAKKGHICVLDYLFDKIKDRLMAEVKTHYEENKDLFKKFPSHEVMAAHYWYKNILIAGAREGQVPIYEYVAKNMTISTDLHKKILAIAAGEARRDLVVKLLDRLKEDSVKQRELLQCSLEKVVQGRESGYLGLAQELIEMGANPFDYAIQTDETPLLSLQALKTSKIELSFSTTERTPLSVAALRGKKALLEILLACKAPESSDYFQKSLALIYAAKANSLEMVRRLLGDGRINLFITLDGKTAMMHAIANKWFRVAGEIASQHLTDALGDPYADTSDLNEDEVVQHFDNPEYGQMVFHAMHYNSGFFQ